jgi:hypothetical protein
MQRYLMVKAWLKSHTATDLKVMVVLDTWALHDTCLGVI